MNFNGGEKLIRCLAALQHQSFPLDDLVVVDNASTDGSPARVREELENVRIIELGENRGPSGARNVGLRELETELVLSVDCDVYLAEDSLEHLVRAQRDADAALVCPRVRLHPEKEVVQCDGGTIHFLGTLALRHGFRPAHELKSAGRFVGGSIGACLLLDRAAVLAAGGFDEAYFFYFEDTEISLKLRIRGHELFCEPASVVYHDRGQGIPGLSFRGKGEYPQRRAYLSMRNRWLTILVYYRLWTLFVLSPALLAYELATVTVALSRGWFRSWIRAWLWLIRNGRNVRRRRKEAQEARALEDRELLDGGPIPLAPGFLHSRLTRNLTGLFSFAVNGYWRLVRGLLPRGTRGR